MTPALATSLLPVRPGVPMGPLPAQAAGFDALLSASSAPVAAAAVTPVGQSMDTPPASQDNEVVTSSVPATKLEADILPLLAAFGDGAAHETISVVSQLSPADEAGNLEIESDDVLFAQRDCAEFVVPTPLVIPTPIALPATVLATAIPAALPTAPAIVKPNQPPRVGASKGGDSAMEPEVNIVAPTGSASVPNIGARQNNAPLGPQDVPLLVNSAGAISGADLVSLLAAAPVESNSVVGAGFQSIMSDRLAETGIRPVTDASDVIAERALDMARGSLWLDQLAADIAAVQDHDRDLSFRLIPAQLGQLDVNIGTRDDGLQLNFSTQSEEAARIIGSAQTRLIEELKAQGVRVAGSEVNSGSEQSTAEQQNSQSARAGTITEFERSSPPPPEPTHANDRQNGLFA